MTYEAFHLADGESNDLLDHGRTRTGTQVSQLPVQTLSSSLHCLRLSVSICSYVYCFSLKLVSMLHIGR